MPVYRTSLTVAHRPENLFELVSDFRRYPDFIRWIQSMRVSGERIEGEVAHSIGEASVGFRGFSERFATRVAANAADRTIETRLLRGPFRHLNNFWRFTELPDGRTRIDFEIDYEFSNVILRMLARSNFKLAVDRIMDAFLTEADRRYPRIGAAGT